MAVYNQFKPSVSAQLEDWDDTTDSIVWLIENNEQFHSSCPKLTLESTPERYGCSSRMSALDSQTATLTGYTAEHQKVKFEFTAEATQIQVPEPESKNGFAEADAYLVTVEKQDPESYRMKPFAKFTVKGYDRSNFTLEA
jgi:hypothetical protein